jgi:ureidoglycolate dehydrogenase (NAD+)
MAEVKSRSYITLSADDLRQLIFDLASAAGATSKNADALADAYLHADLSGVGLQGIDYLPYLLDQLLDGRVDGSVEPRIAKETVSSALVDGGLGIGQTAGIFAVDVAVGKAKETGVSAVGVANSSDIFMLGFYTNLIAEAGLIGMAFTAGPPLVHPYGGVERLLSTNPISIAFPVGEKPVLLDMATSALSRSRIRQAAYHGEKVPPGTGLNAEGEPTVDADELYRGGVLAPLAGHKGFGLALCVALMAGPLTGSAIGPDLSWMDDGGESVGMGHFFMAIDPDAFSGTFAEDAEDYLAKIKASRKAPGVEEIRIPGERGALERQKRHAKGVSILEATWNIISRRADELGVALPQILSS